MKRHRVYRVRMSTPLDPGYSPSARPPRNVCAECGQAVEHVGRMVRGTPWIHARRVQS